jgi:hypothetical protein
MSGLNTFFSNSNSPNQAYAYTEHELETIRKFTSSWNIQAKTPSIAACSIVVKKKINEGIGKKLDSFFYLKHRVFQLKF